MHSILIIIPSIIALVAVCISKWMNDELKVRDLSLTFHINGILLFVPILLDRKDLMDYLLVVLVSCSLFLVVTGTCFSKSKKRTRFRTITPEIIASGIGGCVFAIGIVLNIML